MGERNEFKWVFFIDVSREYVLFAIVNKIL